MPRENTFTRSHKYNGYIFTCSIYIFLTVQNVKVLSEVLVKLVPAIVEQVFRETHITVMSLMREWDMVETVFF